MLTAGDVLAKTLAKSQKVTFWSKKIALDAFFFFLLTAGDALMIIEGFTQILISRSYGIR